MKVGARRLIVQVVMILQNWIRSREKEEKKPKTPLGNTCVYRIVSEFVLHFATAPLASYVVLDSTLSLPFCTDVCCHFSSDSATATCVLDITAF